MAIKPKIEKIQDEIISKGGRVSADFDEDSWVLTSFRITRKLINKIDEDLRENVGLSRNAWILLAIQEKLKREK